MKILRRRTEMLFRVVACHKFHHGEIGDIYKVFKIAVFLITEEPRPN